MALRNAMRVSILAMLVIGAATTAWAESSPGSPSTRGMEKLNRGLVAVKLAGKGVYLGWRLLGTDPKTIGFDVYRNGKKLNPKPITDSTNYVDSKGTGRSRYSVRATVNGKSLAASKVVRPQKQQYIEIPLTPPSPFPIPGGKDHTYKPHEASVADLDGDGEYELVFKWCNVGKDVAHNGYTTPTILEAIELDGTSLWRINLGINIRSGSHYTQLMVYDLDGDGKAEVVCRTSDGTIDGKGQTLGDATTTSGALWWRGAKLMRSE